MMMTGGDSEWSWLTFPVGLEAETWSWLKDTTLVALVFALSLALVFVCVGIGWMIMWKLFLSRFQFIREILSSDEKEAQFREQRDRASSKKKLRKE